MNDFENKIANEAVDLSPRNVSIMQINLTKLCNQACNHCHVASSPARTESMSIEVLDQCLNVLKNHDEIHTLDLTGGAPELHPHFDHFVRQATSYNKKVMVRHNLTVTLDGHPKTGESKEYLPQFFAQHGVEVVSSLPYYEEYFTDRQRGSGVFKKSIQSLQLLVQQGYGKEGSGLSLNLVYNPIGSFLPAAQDDLEKRYKDHLKKNFDIHFNKLFALTNMPIKRFHDFLLKSSQYEEYMQKLINAFNPTAALGVMCRDMLSIDHQGFLYDCDFNQMLELKVNCQQQHIKDFKLQDFLSRKIVFKNHCFGCTAGAGSSCGGSTTQGTP